MSQDSWYKGIVDPLIYKSVHDLQAPTGYKEPTSSKFQTTQPKSVKLPSTRRQVNELKIKKGWEIAMAPVKSLPMTLFMNYMTGNALQIISISMTFMQLINPLKAIYNFSEPFKFMESGDQADVEQIAYDILLVKLAFVAAQLLCLGVGIYKLNAMGLIPNSSSDWLSWESYPEFKELNIGIF